MRDGTRTPDSRPEVRIDTTLVGDNESFLKRKSSNDEKSMKGRKGTDQKIM